ncbi:MAG: hypothetical protein ACOYJR_03270 [Acutalibacteraceae bacterium]|jgi:hypothetical protein
MLFDFFSADVKESSKHKDEKQTPVPQGDLDDFIFVDQENHCSER